jgi:hypothetical protein
MTVLPGAFSRCHWFASPQGNLGCFPLYPSQSVIDRTLGFKQCSLHLGIRALLDMQISGFSALKLSEHAIFPSSFRLQVGPVAQECYAQLLPCYTGIKLRRDTAHPVPFVMAAQELALVLAFPDEEQQMAVGGLHVEDGDLGLGRRLLDDLEELALAVGLHVQRDNARRAVAASRTISDLQSSADAGELDIEEVGVHERGDTIRAQGVRRFPAITVIGRSTSLPACREMGSAMTPSWRKSPRQSLVVPKETVW